MILTGCIIGRRQYVVNGSYKFELTINLFNSDGVNLGQIVLPVKDEWFDSYLIGGSFKFDMSLPINAPPPKSKGIKKAKAAKRGKLPEPVETPVEALPEIEVTLE